MFCRFCGNELADGSNFCPKCGKIVVTEPEESKENTNEFVITDSVIPEIEDTERTAKEGKILLSAILGLAFALSFYLSPIGIIFSIIARSKVRRYISEYGETRKRATVGRHISLAGLIASIVFTVILALIVVIVLAFGLSALNSDTSVFGEYYI